MALSHKSLSRLYVCVKNPGASESRAGGSKIGASGSPCSGAAYMDRTEGPAQAKMSSARECAV